MLSGATKCRNWKKMGSDLESACSITFITKVSCKSKQKIFFHDQPTQKNFKVKNFFSQRMRFWPFLQLANVDSAKNAFFESYHSFSYLEGALAPPRSKLLKICHSFFGLAPIPAVPTVSWQTNFAFLSYELCKERFKF